MGRPCCDSRYIFAEMFQATVENAWIDDGILALSIGLGCSGLAPILAWRLFTVFELHISAMPDDVQNILNFWGFISCHSLHYFSAILHHPAVRHIAQGPLRYFLRAV
jgi:hypothetical protein